MNKAWIIKHESYINEGYAYKIFTNWKLAAEEIDCHPELLLCVRPGDKIIVNNYTITVENVD